MLIDYRVDTGGLAEHKGLKVGDQIVAVNATSFENITHANAVEILRSNATLVITVKVLWTWIDNP